MAGGDTTELLLGMVRDPQFGPLVMVGFGGIFVEILGDIATRLAPVTTAEALAMLAELRMAPALHGFRSRPPADLDALASTVSRFSRLAFDVPSLLELEINPLLAGPAGARALRRPRPDVHPGGPMKPIKRVVVAAVMLAAVATACAQPPGTPIVDRGQAASKNQGCYWLSFSSESSAP